MIENSPESPLVSLETLSPTALLDNLTKAAANAVDQATRDKFGGLAQDLEKALANRQTGATADAKSSTNSLKEMMAKISGSLTGDEKKLMSSTEKPFTVPSQKAVGEIKDVANKGLEAIKTGDIKGAKDAAVSVAESVGVDSKKILAGGGIAAVGAAISEVIGNIGTTISGFFEKIMTLLKTLFGGIFGGGVGAVAAKVEDSVSGAKKQIFGEPKKAEVSEAEKAKLAVEKSFDQAPAKLRARMVNGLKEWGYSENDAVKSSKFNQVWKEFEPEMLSLLNTQKNALQGGTHNIIDSLIDSISIPTRLILRLVTVGVIPYSAVSTYVYEGAIVLSLKSLRGMLQFGNDQMEGTLARMSIDNFDKEKENLSADEKAILGQIFAHTHVVGAYLLGAAGAAVTKVGSLVFAWNESVGLTGLLANFNGVTGDWAKATEKMQKIASYLGNTAELEQIANANRNMLQVFQEQITKGHLTAVFNAAKDPADLLVKMRALESLANSSGPESLISKKLLEEANIRIFGNKAIPALLDQKQNMQTLSQGMRGFILNTDAGKIRHILGTPALFDRFKSTFSRAPSASGHYVDMVESSLQNINKSMAVSIESKAEGKGFNWIWDKIKLAVGPSAYSEIAKNAQKGIVSVQLGQSESVSKAIAQLSTEAPGLVSSFFNIFPLVIVAGSVAMSEDKLAATKAGLIGLTPLVGPLYLIHNGFEMKGLDFVNVSIVGLGMTQLAIEGVMFANIMRGPNRLVNLGLFMARPFNMAYQAAKGIGQMGGLIGTRLGASAAGGAVGTLERTVLKSRSWQTAGALTAMAFATAAVVYGPEHFINGLDGKRSTEFLTENGFLGNDGAINMALVKERFNTLSSDQKKKVVDYIAMSSLGRDYSIDVKEGINIQAHGAVSLDVLKQMQADIVSVLGEGAKVQVALSDKGISTWYEHLKAISKNDTFAIKDAMMKGLELSSNDLAKKLPKLFA